MADVSLGGRLVTSGSLAFLVPFKWEGLVYCSRFEASFADDFSSEAQSWRTVFSLLVLCRGTWSRPLTQPWWKCSSQFYTAFWSSFPTWRRSSPRSSVGSKQVWKLEERQASQAAAQVLKEHNLRMGSWRICSESMSMLGPGLSGREYHPESKVLKGSSQVCWCFSECQGGASSEPPTHTSSHIAVMLHVPSDLWLLSTECRKYLQSLWQLKSVPTYFRMPLGEW